MYNLVVVVAFLIRRWFYIPNINQSNGMVLCVMCKFLLEITRQILDLKPTIHDLSISTRQAEKHLQSKEPKHCLTHTEILQSPPCISHKQAFRPQLKLFILYYTPSLLSLFLSPNVLLFFTFGAKTHLLLYLRLSF